MSVGKGPRTEESVLHSIFAHFSNFNFDKAKDHAEKERDASRNSGTLLWTGFLNSVSQLSIAEKLNMNLGFIATKSFLRKENSGRATYEALLTDLADLEKRHAPIVDMKFNNAIAECMSSNNRNTDRMIGASSPGTEGVLLHLCTHLELYIQARIQLIAFYEKLIISSSNKWMDFNELYDHITDVTHRNNKHFHHPVLSSLKTNFSFECDIMAHLLGSLKDMQSWKFFDALLHLDGAQSKLISWFNIVQSKETKKYGFRKASPVPPLYQWLCSAKTCLVAKFSLYFYETLAGQSSPQDMKYSLSRQNIDYVTKIQAFQRKTDTHCICLVVDASEVSNFRGPGYHHPREDAQQLTGMDAYPAIFSYPSKPVDYWPVIVSKISEYKNDLFCGDKVGYYYDRKTGTTTYLCQADPNITLVALFQFQKSEKDTSIRDFMFDLAHQLRCIKIFSNLKPK